MPTVWGPKKFRGARHWYRAGLAGRGQQGRFAFAVQWIAENDEPTDLDEQSVAGYTTTLLVADTFGMVPAEVASVIVGLRREG